MRGFRNRCTVWIAIRWRLILLIAFPLILFYPLLSGISTEEIALYGVESSMQAQALGSRLSQVDWEPPVDWDPVDPVYYEFPRYLPLLVRIYSVLSLLQYRAAV